MKKAAILLCVAGLLICAAGAASAAEEPYFGYDIDDGTLSVMENYEYDKTDYRDKIFIFIYDNDKLIKAAPAQPGVVENEFMTTVPVGIENIKVKAAYVNDNGGLNIENVPHYFCGLVDYVKADKNEVEIYFKEHSDDISSHIKFNRFSDVNITCNGEKVDYNSIEEWDVLSIACESGNTDFDNMSDFDMKISKLKIEDSFANNDPEEGVLELKGIRYKTTMDYIFDDEFPYYLDDDNSQYMINIDSFGRAVYFEAPIGGFYPIAVVVGMYEGEGEFPVVQLFNIGGLKGRLWELECKDDKEADNFYNFLTGTNEGYKGELTTEELMPRISTGQTCCKYRLTNGRLGLKNSSQPVGGKGLRYDSRSKTLGGFRLDEKVTEIYDISDYISGETELKRLKPDELSEDISYTAYLNYKNSDSVYWSVLITAME